MSQIVLNAVWFLRILSLEFGLESVEMNIYISYFLKLYLVAFI